MRSPLRARPSRSAGRRRRGFTLFELLVTLAVISLVAAVTVATYFSSSEVTLENAGVLLAQELRTVENRSAFLGQPATVVFFEDGYRVLGAEGRPLVNPRTEQPFERRYSRDGVFRGVRVLECRFGTGSVLEIDRDGLPRQGGRVVLGFGGATRELVVGKEERAFRLVGSTSGWIDPGT